MMEGKKIQCEECNKQSLVTAVNKFVCAVSSMDEKILVPNRLRDMDVSEVHDLDTMEENNNRTPPLHLSSSGEELYSHYVMLNDIKRHVITGKCSDNGCELGSTGGSSNEDSDDSGTDSARQTADAFRYHLQSLFSMLHQLTNTAKAIGNTYENEVGANKKLKKFVI